MVPTSRLGWSEDKEMKRVKHFASWFNPRRPICHRHNNTWQHITVKILNVTCKACLVFIERSSKVMEKT